MGSKSVSTSTLVCLTGGIATGKSQVADWFVAKGWMVICSDKIVHQLYEAGQPLPRKLSKEFGAKILTKDGGVNRTRLGEIVFYDESALKRLNALVHPRVREIWKERAMEAVREGKKTLVVIPLAYETQANQEFQQTWVAACSKAEQERRMCQRGLNSAQIARRLSFQWPLQKKIDLADVVIWNNAAWSLMEEQLVEIVKNVDPGTG